MPVNKFGVTTDAFGNRIRSGVSSSQSGGGGGGGGGVSQSYVDTNFMRKDGSSSFTGDLSMNGHKINDLQSPAPGDPDDTAATKGYVDQSIADETTSIFQTAGQTYLSRVNGGSVSGAINMNGNNITGLPSVPTFTSAAASKAYVDNQTTATLQNINNTFLRKDGANAMTGNLNADSFRITNLPVPQDDGDAINTTYADGRYLKLDGTGVMTGALNVGFQTIENMQPPTTENQPATKKYVDEEIVKSMTLNSNFLAELSNEVEVTSSAAFTRIAPWGVVRTEGDDVSVTTLDLTSDMLSINGQATITVTTTYRLPSAAFAPRLDCIFSFSRESDGASVIEQRIENQTAGTYTFTASHKKESEGTETYRYGVLNSNRRFFVETSTQVEVFGSGGSYVKTSEFNLVELSLDSGSLPLGNGTVVLQDNVEGRNKIVLTLSSPTQGLMQFAVYPSLLDVAMANWVFNVGGLITFNGANHKNVSFVPGGDFQITSIAGR